MLAVALADGMLEEEDDSDEDEDEEEDGDEEECEDHETSLPAASGEHISS